MDLRRRTQPAVDKVIEFLEQHKKEITTSEEIAQVATIRANGDTHVRSLIAEKVGKEGVITVKEGKTIEDKRLLKVRLLLVTCGAPNLPIPDVGMCFDHGYISPYFITDVKSQKTELEPPLPSKHLASATESLSSAATTSPFSPVALCSQTSSISSSSVSLPTSWDRLAASPSPTRTPSSLTVLEPKTVWKHAVNGFNAPSLLILLLRTMTPLSSRSGLPV
jgi:hypothetical protein